MARQNTERSRWPPSDSRGDGTSASIDVAPSGDLRIDGDRALLDIPEEPGRTHPVLSIVFPVNNEAESLEELHSKVTEAVVQIGLPYELLFVDDGSVDESLAITKSLAARDPRVRYVSLSRNFGHQAALVTGLAHARGDAVITMDADLQHPPSLIPTMVRLWREGHDVVYTSKRSYTTLPPLRRFVFKTAYWVLTRFSSLDLSFGQSDFRLLDRGVVDVIVEIPEQRKFLRGLVHWVGFRQQKLEYDVQPRFAGRPSYTTRALIRLLVDGFIGFSAVPLRWSLSLGLFAALLSGLYGAWVFIQGILYVLGIVEYLPPGFATIVVAVVFLGSVQLIAIGVLSEYMGRVYDQVRGRPPSIVRERSEVAAHRGVRTGVR
jgi:dolichol-phosphate mannosyltransferase